MNTFQKQSVFRHDLLKVFLCVFGALVLSKGISLLPGYAADDYTLARKEAGVRFFLTQGRFTEAIIQKLTNQLGFYWTDIYFTNTILLFIAYGLLISLCVLALRPRESAILIPCVGGVIIACHPYFSALLLFREASINSLFCITLLVIFVHFWLPLSRLQPGEAAYKNILAATLALCLAIGCYQAALSIALCFVIPVLAQELLLTSNKSTTATRYFIKAASPVVLAIVAYALINLILKSSLGIVSEDRSKFLSLSALPNRLVEASSLWKALLISGTPISSGFLTIFQALLLMAGILCARQGRTKISIVAFLLYPALTLLSTAPFIVSAVWWPVHRALASVGIALGLVAVMSIASAGRFQRTLIAGWLFVSWGLALHSSSMFMDQLRVNRWDLHRAQLIAWK
ncbi:glucosyltransferase domain-containing protein [Pseudomonas nicosulfuronedens]